MVDEVLELGEPDDVVEVLLDLLAGDAEEGRVDVDVLPAGEIRVEAGAELQQRGEAALRAHLPGARLEDAGDALEQGRLARAVVPEDADGLPLLDGEVDVTEGPEVLVRRAAELEDALLHRIGPVRVEPEVLREIVDHDRGHMTSAKLPSALSKILMASRNRAVAKTKTTARLRKYHHTDVSGRRWVTSTSGWWVTGSTACWWVRGSITGFTMSAWP